jgi:cyclic pyranopterin phosphate synthase
MASVELTHLDAQGRARMVDVADKAETERFARAEAVVRVAPETAQRLRDGDNPKGDVVAVSRIAAIQAAKRTDELIPLCHQLPLSHVGVEVEITDDEVVLTVETKTTARTGVEMEAMVAASVGALTVYDMVKGIEPGVTIERVRLLEKTGGKADFHR